jgi:hypothetical protein
MSGQKKQQREDVKNANESVTKTLSILLSSPTIYPCLYPMK